MDDLLKTLERASGLHRAGNLPQAEALYQQVLAASPKSHQAIHGLALLRFDQGSIESAISLLQQCVAIDGSNSAYHGDLAQAYRAIRRLDDAIACCQRALALWPNDAAARTFLAGLYHQQGKVQEAVAGYEAAVACDPNLAQAQHNLGVLRMELGRPAAAIDCLKRAIAAQPAQIESYLQLGAALEQLGRFDEALATYLDALRLDPASGAAFGKLGNIFFQLGNWEQGQLCHEQHVRMHPFSGEAHVNRAFGHLLHGRFSEGWADYVWLRMTKTHRVPLINRALWNGTRFPGQTLMVYCEERASDILHFVRYLPMARQLGGTVLLAAPPALMPLLRCAGIEGVVDLTAPPMPFDLYLPLVQVPAVFRTSFDTVPANVPYLAADSQLVAQWRERLKGNGGLKVGIVWRDVPASQDHWNRSIPLRQFASLARIPGVQWFSLQQAAQKDSLAEITDQMVINDLAVEVDDSRGAFMDLAAIIKNLDLVICCDCATAHLAGALGQRVWLAVSRAPDWRWFLDRGDSPWYPTMQLFRQPGPGDWSGAFARIADQLARLVSEAGNPPRRAADG